MLGCFSKSPVKGEDQQKKQSGTTDLKKGTSNSAAIKAGRPAYPAPEDQPFTPNQPSYSQFQNGQPSPVTAPDTPPQNYTEAREDSPMAHEKPDLRYNSYGGANGAKSLKFRPQDDIRFVTELPSRPTHRRAIIEIVRNEASVTGRGSRISSYVKDSGYEITGLEGLSQAVKQARSTNLIVWASRYNLFVVWSADQKHPWDRSPTANNISAILEIGSAPGSREAVVLLNGARIESWSFKNGRFTTQKPVPWTSPSGQVVDVELSLAFSTFVGYANQLDDDDSPLRYFGLQCQGSLWPADSGAYHDWPNAAPTVFGKVNVSSREAAVNSGGADELAVFKGQYNTHYLAYEDDKHAATGPILDISHVGAGDVVVAIDGVPVRGWTFASNNVLEWSDSSGNSAWLLLQLLPEGPIILGDIPILDNNNKQPTGFAVFGELKGQQSRLSPNGRMNPALGSQVATGLQAVASLIVGDILHISEKLARQPFGSSHKLGVDEGKIAELEALLEQKATQAAKVELVAEQFANYFLDTSADGEFTFVTEINENLVPSVYQAMEAAHSKAEIARNMAIMATKDSNDANKAELALEVQNATYHASQASLHALGAAEACRDAEKLASDGAALALKANTAFALDYSLSAAQAFNQAQDEALKAAQAESAAAESALTSVTGEITNYVNTRSYENLREIAQASNLATKISNLASEASNAWKVNTVISRKNALGAARAASIDAQECHKITRRVQPSNNMTKNLSGAISGGVPIKGSETPSARAAESLYEKVPYARGAESLNEINPSNAVVYEDAAEHYQD